MTICKNESDPGRDDEYGKDGYTACCPKEACLKKIGVEGYYKTKIGKPDKEEVKSKSNSNDSNDPILKYQYLKCYQCGDKKEGQMTICKNISDPDRNDEYGKDGYTACCPKEAC